MIDDRINDIRFHDKTKYDEKVAHMTSDYIDMARELIKRMNAVKSLISDEKKVSKTENSLINDLKNMVDFDQVLEMPAKTTSRDDKKRTYKELLDGRFDINVCRIDRHDDEDTISGKHSDFSSYTIKALMDRGEQDAIKSFERCIL